MIAGAATYCKGVWPAHLQFRKSWASLMAGEMGGAREGNPRHSRIARIAAGEWMAATILMRPRQRGHSSTSMAKTLRISSAQV